MWDTFGMDKTEARQDCTDVVREFAHLSDNIVRGNATVRAFVETTQREIEAIWQDVADMRDQMVSDFATRDDLSDLRAEVRDLIATPLDGGDAA